MEILHQAIGAVRQTDRWDLGLLAARAVRMFRLLVNPALHRRVHEAIAPTGLTKVYPRTAFKYLGAHLARSLSLPKRAAILAHHYGYLRCRVAEPALSRILFGTLPLWQTALDSHALGIHLAFSHPYDREGELSLSLQANSNDIFTLGFTICPGRVLGVDADHALLVSRLQGRKRYFELIREVSKSAGDVSPAAMLVAALAGLAQALEIRDMVSIGAKEQVATTIARESTYDEFWASLGARRLDGDFFHVEMPPPEKPLSRVKQHHRARTLVKRRFKKRIADHVCAEFGRHLCSCGAAHPDGCTISRMPSMACARRG